MQQPITIETNKQPNACVIWLHGLGGSSEDFTPVLPLLNIPDRLSIRFLFPQAPKQRVTLNRGLIMPAWYDIYALDGSQGEDASGLRASGLQLSQWIDEQIQHGIEAKRILLIGFSQGGAVSLQCGLRYPSLLGGIALLSSYVPLADTLDKESHQANQSVPILMCQGDTDTIIPMDSLGNSSLQILKAHGYQVDYRVYSMGHELCSQEITDLGNWIVGQLD